MQNLLPGEVPRSAADVRAYWSRLTRPQRLTLAGVVGVAAIVLGVFVNVARTPDYAVAFSGLKDEDAAAIVAKLKDNKIPYQLGERGTIRVPAGQAQEARLLMAAQGLPARGSSAGFEMFNEPKLGLTEFAEKVNYNRALEGELARTISNLDAVESARVHLVIPQPSLFTSQQKDATASVVVQLKAGRRVDAAQIEGITSLVAGSVEGLKPQNITVMDTAGGVLNDRAVAGDPAKQTGTRADVQRALESRLETDVRTMLARMLGPERVLVRVRSDLDWDQYESSSETYSPEQRQPQIRSQRQVTETSNSNGSRAGGIPGSDGNLPTYPALQGGDGQSQAERRETSTNYEVSKTVEKLVRAPGGIKRLSVAVALDSEAVNDPEQADAISRLVATAAGLNLARGDVVTLTSMPFSTAERQASQAADAARQRELILTLARLFAMVLGPLGVAAVIWLLLRRGRAQPAPTITVTGHPHAQLLAALEQPAELPEEAAQRSLPPPQENPETQRLQKELSHIADTSPATVAMLVRTWLQEDRR